MISDTPEKRRSGNHMRPDPVCVLVMIVVAVSAMAQTRNSAERHEDLEPSLPGNLAQTIKNSGKLSRQVRPGLSMPMASCCGLPLEKFSMGSVVPAQIRPGARQQRSRVSNHRGITGYSRPSDAYVVTLQYFLNEPEESLLLHRATIAHGNLNRAKREPAPTR